jgi:hypothetical protein
MLPVEETWEMVLLQQNVVWIQRVWSTEMANFSYSIKIMEILILTIIWKYICKNRFKYKLGNFQTPRGPFWSPHDITQSWNVSVKMVFANIQAPNFNYWSFFFQDLRESLDKNQDKISKLKKMLKVYAKRLKDGEGKNNYWDIILPWQFWVGHLFVITLCYVVVVVVPV